MKKLISICCSLLLAACTFTSCATASSSVAKSTGTDAAATGNSAGGLDKNIEATLTFSTWDNDEVKLFKEKDLQGKFQELYPNVTIEVEEFKDDNDYFNSLKVRASASQLPDIMYLKTQSLATYQDYLVELNDLEATGKNMLAEGYAIDNQILGLPARSANDYVYYWKDMFEEAGVEVPQTWDEYVAAAKKLQEHFGASDPTFSAIGLGAKDEWPTYPYVEYAPAAVSGDGRIWDSMVGMEAPFEEGSAVNKAYAKVYELFSSGACGADPLGIGMDQARALFGQKKSAIMAGSQMLLTGIKGDGIDLTELGSFYMPFRDSESDPLNLVSQGDFFMCVSNNSQNPELAKAFVEWFYSDAWYPEYILALNATSTIEGVESAKDPILDAAAENSTGVEFIMYDGGGEDFQNMSSATKFDCKKLGVEMFMDGFDFDAKMEELNTTWQAGREQLGLA